MTILERIAQILRVLLASAAIAVAGVLAVAGTGHAAAGEVSKFKHVLSFLVEEMKVRSKLL
jgi:hypothetical protein